MICSYRFTAHKSTNSPERVLKEGNLDKKLKPRIVAYSVTRAFVAFACDLFGKPE
jgi:hypothetical protein